MKKALITGVTGQDGCYLAENLLEKGYKVFGTSRLCKQSYYWRIKELNLMNHPNFALMKLDITNREAVFEIIKELLPNEIYNFAAPRLGELSLATRLPSAAIANLSVVNFLDSIKIINPKIKFFQASAGEMFGPTTSFHTENSPFFPQNPYEIAKLNAHWLTLHYRQAYNIFAVCGILFNHESPLRSKNFITRKISDTVAKIHLGIANVLEIGNLDVQHDWGYAKDYAEGIWRMLQLDYADTFILATNRSTSVREFLSLCFQHAGIEIDFIGSGLSEIGVDKKSKKTLLKIDPSLYATFHSNLRGSSEKARHILNWQPGLSIEKISELMTLADLKRNHQTPSLQIC